MNLKLYITPGSCSLAPHIVAREIGLELELIRVDLDTKKTEHGDDYNVVNPKGSVPALVLSSGDVLTETSVILSYLAALKPAERVSPPCDFDRYRVQEALNFVATELHKTLGLLFNEEMPQAGKEVALATARKRFDYLDSRLANGAFLAGEYSVADAYAFTILSWTRFLNIELGPWPHVQAYLGRIAGRPAVQAALVAEGLVPADEAA